ncbi:carbon monoxide dehydrogenase [Rummeliibacillus pycnus]|uniref:carbon monoxide dehydrogenase n=1 Tax=Rummeliibacillus pycnus TaxID=101070 RepID=UPI003D2868FB
MKKDSCSQAGENNPKINLGAIKVNKSIPLILFLLVIFGVKIGTVSANTKDSPPPSIEETFSEAGFKTVEESVEEFENYFECDVELPRMTPSISFTHRFGRFYEDKQYNMNHSLAIRFVNKDIRENIYKIDIRPLKNKINFKDKLNLNGKEFTLQDGSKAIYFESHQFNFLVFEKNDLQYLLGIYRKVPNTVTPESLVKIANSIK